MEEELRQQLEITKHPDLIELKLQVRLSFLK